MALMNVFVLLACLVVNRVSQVMNDAYKILSPAQEFYAQSVIKTPSSPNKYFAFGGWFKGTKEFTIPNFSNSGSFVQVDGSDDTFNKLTPSDTSNVTVSKMEWIFVAWINEINVTGYTTATLLDQSPADFYNVSVVSVILSRGWMAAPTNATSSVSIGPFAVSNPGINGTFAFEYDNTDNFRRYVNLFYSFHDSETRMYKQLVCFMVGPYKGDIRYYRANKLNRNFTGDATLFYTGGSAWLDLNSQKLLEITDREGLYIPTMHMIYVNRFINADKANTQQRYGKVRTILMRCSMKFMGQNGDSAYSKTQLMSLMVLVPNQGSIRTQLSIQRSTGAASLSLIIGNNASEIRTLTKNLSFAVSGDEVWHYFSLKLSFIGSELQGSPNANLHSYFIVLADISHKQSNNPTIDHDSVIFSKVDWLASADADMTISVTHELESPITQVLNESLHGYLHSLTVLNGGMDYTESGASSSYDKQYCLVASVLQDTQRLDDVNGYCIECIEGYVLNKGTGRCEDVANPIADCDKHHSQTECDAYDKNNYFYNQFRLDNPRPKTSGCVDSNFKTTAQLFSRQNMSETCSEMKLEVNATCTYFTNYDGTNCICRISQCQNCDEIECDRCGNPFTRIMNGKSISCQPSPPRSFGLNIATNKYTPCLSKGCVQCTADYTKCDSCDTFYVLTLAKSCMFCGPSFRRYFNTTTKVCHICHSSCMTCKGPTKSDCVTCPIDDLETRFYMNVTEAPTLTGYCVSCAQEQLYYNTTKNQYAVGFVWDNSTTQPRCSWCNETCKTCANASFCTSCNASKYIQPYGHCADCVMTEPYYIDGIYCRMCYYTCKTCNITDRNCTSCRNDSYLTVNNTCELCDMNCNGCSGTKKNCTKCRAGMYRYPHNGWCGYCYEEGFVLNETSKECVKCGNNCRYCDASKPQACLSCIQNTFLFPINKTCGACDTKGKWYEESIFCKACDASCGTCTGGLATMCVNCDYPFEKILEKGRCEYTELLFTSSYYEKVMTYVVFPFETKVKIDGEVEDSMEAAVFVEATSLEDPLNALTFNSSLLTLPGIALPTTALVTGIKVSGTSVIVQLSIVATVKNASVVLKFKKSGAVRAASSRTWKFINVSLVHTGITVIRSAFDSALDSAGSTAASAVAIITLPQALVLLKLLNSLGLYVFVDIEFPSNFNKLLEMLTTTTVLDFVPNLYLPFADDEGQPLPERFAKYDIEVHFFKNFGPTLTVITGLCLIKLMTNPFKRCARSKKSMWLFRFLGKVYSFLSLEFWLTLLESAQFDYVLSLCIYLTSRQGVDEWKPTNYIVILGLSASSLSLITFYCFLTFKTRKLTEAYYKHAILPVEMMKDEPFKFILEDKALPGNVFQRYFTVVVLFKDLFTCLIVYFCVTQPVVVTSLMSLTQFAFTLGVIVTPPFSLRKNNMLLTIESVLYTVLNFCLLVLALGAKKLNTDFKYYFIGFFLSALTVLLLISNIGFTLYYTAVEIKKKCRAFKAKKAEKHAVTETSRHGLSEHSIAISSSLENTKLKRRMMAKPIAGPSNALEAEGSLNSNSSLNRASSSSPRKLVANRIRGRKTIGGRRIRTISANEIDTTTKSDAILSQFDTIKKPEPKRKRLRVKQSAQDKMLLDVPTANSAMQTSFLKVKPNVSVDNNVGEAVKVRRRAKSKNNIMTGSERYI